MAIDYTTYIGQIRALINDTNEENLELNDEQLDAYYCMSYGSVLDAALMALRGLVSKYSATGGDKYRVDTIEYEEGKSKASNYLSLLTNLEKSIKEGTNPMIVGVPKVFGVYREDREENIKRMIDGEIIPPKISDTEYDVARIKQQDGPYYRG